MEERCVGGLADHKRMGVLRRPFLQLIELRR